MFIIFSCHIIIDYGILTVNLYSSGSTSEGIYMTRKQELKDIDDGSVTLSTIRASILRTCRVDPVFARNSGNTLYIEGM